ncbi:MAG: helix-turn-helix domain-containing protein [Candidatus Aquicultor sp.]
MQAATIAYNLRLIRDAKGIKQDQVAEEAGLSRTAYRNIETGKAIPKVSTLQSIATALNVKLQDLLVPVKPLKAIRFRASNKMNNRDQIVVNVSRWLDDFNYLEDLLNNKIAYDLDQLSKQFSGQEPGAQKAIAAAEKAREALGLKKDELIRDICGLLEAEGIKIYTISLSSKGFFGLSVAASEGGPAIIVNVWDRIAVERWIYTVAHELGHLILHLNSYDVERVDEDESQEEEANIFASYFLMPQGVFEKEWQEAYGLSFLDRVLKIKRIFRVSYRTVLYRLSTTTSIGDKAWMLFHVNYKKRYGKSLGSVDEPQGLKRSNFHMAYPEALRSSEPEHLNENDFVEDRLSALVRTAIEKEEISLSRGAEILRIDLADMRERAASWVD